MNERETQLAMALFKKGYLYAQMDVENEQSNGYSEEDAMQYAIEFVNDTPDEEFEHLMSEFAINEDK